MTVYELRRGMHDHIGPERDRLLKVWRHESVVYHEFRIPRVTLFADRTKITQCHQRIRGRFYEHHPRVLADCISDVAGDRGINVGELHTKIRKDLVEQPRRSTIEVVSADDVITGFVHAGNRVDCGHTAGENL